MKAPLVIFMLIASAALVAGSVEVTAKDDTSNPHGEYKNAPIKAAAKTPPLRIGQIFISGNIFTRHSVILEAFNLFPGQVLRDADLGGAQKDLEKLGIFKPGSVQVTAEYDPNNPNSEYRNIIIKVEETSTWSVRVMPGLNGMGKPVIIVAWEERNFDPRRWPMSLDDLMAGGAFRGAGLVLRLELLQIPLW